MISLIDFLLARIAEDERTLEALRNASEKCEWGELRRVQPYIARHTEQFNGPRLEAECKAKLQIIREADEYYVPDDAEYDGGHGALARVLRALALPYADHPDYREATR